MVGIKDCSCECRVYKWNRRSQEELWMLMSGWSERIQQIQCPNWRKSSIDSKLKISKAWSTSKSNDLIFVSAWALAEWDHVVLSHSKPKDKKQDRNMDISSYCSKTCHRANDIVVTVPEFLGTPAWRVNINRNPIEGCNPGWDLNVY